MPVTVVCTILVIVSAALGALIMHTYRTHLQQRRRAAADS